RTSMIHAKDAVFWTKRETHEIMVRPFSWQCPEDHGLGHGWGDPIGAAYSAWQTASTKERVQLMLETVIDLAAQGYPIKDVLRAFAEVKEFRALGQQSYPMCRALTSALVGKCLEPNAMSFDELLGR